MQCFWCLGAGECELCRHFIVAPESKGQAVGMLMQKAKLTWIASGGRSFQFHKLPKLLVILKNVPRGMLVCLRDFRTGISASDPEALQPESFAGKGKRLLMRHLLQDDVQLHSSCTIQRSNQASLDQAGNVRNQSIVWTTDKFIPQ